MTGVSSEPGRVTIPPEVLADVAAALAEGGARLAAYRPDVEPHAQVLNLHAGDVCEVVRPAAGGTLHVVRGGIASSYLDAWLAVGSVDGGPRPEVGQRVLVLDCQADDHLADTHEPHVGVIGRVAHVDPDGRLDVDFLDGRGAWFAACIVTRWALLPGAESAPACTPVDIARGYIPSGMWRVGGDRPRNLYIGPPRPYGTDVGRMDSPELAALVVEAVNAYRNTPSRERIAPAPLDAVREYPDHTPPVRPLTPTQEATVIRDIAARLRTGPARVPDTAEYRLREAGADEWLRQLAAATEAGHPQGLRTW